MFKFYCTTVFPSGRIHRHGDEPYRMCKKHHIYKTGEKNKKTTFSTIVFSFLFFVFGLFTWQGLKSILIIIAKVLSTIAYGNKSTTIVRAIIFVTSLSWLIYNYCVFSIAGVICEAFTLISLIAGVIRLDIVPQLSKN